MPREKEELHQIAKSIMMSVDTLKIVDDRDYNPLIHEGSRVKRSDLPYSIAKLIENYARINELNKEELFYTTVRLIIFEHLLHNDPHLIVPTLKELDFVLNAHIVKLTIDAIFAEKDAILPAIFLSYFRDILNVDPNILVEEVKKFSDKMYIFADTLSEILEVDAELAAEEENENESASESESENEDPYGYDKKYNILIRVKNESFNHPLDIKYVARLFIIADLPNKYITDFIDNQLLDRVRKDEFLTSYRAAMGEYFRTIETIDAQLETRRHDNLSPVNEAGEPMPSLASPERLSRQASQLFGERIARDEEAYDNLLADPERLSDSFSALSLQNQRPEGSFQTSEDSAFSPFKKDQKDKSRS